LADRSPNDEFDEQHAKAVLNNIEDDVANFDLEKMFFKSALKLDRWTPPTLALQKLPEPSLQDRVFQAAHKIYLRRFEIALKCTDPRSEPARNLRKQFKKLNLDMRMHDRFAPEVLSRFRALEVTM